jgi:hypothetical protein
MTTVIISPKTGQKVLVFKTPSHKHVMRDIGKGTKNIVLNAQEGDMINYVTLENYGKVQPITIRNHDKSRRTV